VSQIGEYDRLIQLAALKYLPGYDWRLYKAQLWQESKLNPYATSPAGARGIAQFMPTTWREWSPKAGFAGADVVDPEASIFTGACYMAWLIGQWSSPRPDMDRYLLAAASYNAGLGNILKAQVRSGNALWFAPIIRCLDTVTGNASLETTTYCKRILQWWAQEITG